MQVKKLPTGKGIGLLNHGAGTAIFRPVINTAGAYVLTLLIHKQFTRNEEYLQVVVNGKVHEVFFPSTKAPSPTGRAQLIIRLRAGENEIVLRNPVKTRADSSFIQYQRMGNALKAATKKWRLKRDSEKSPSPFQFANGALQAPGTGALRQATCGAPRRILCRNGSAFT